MEQKEGFQSPSFRSELLRRFDWVDILTREVNHGIIRIYSLLESFIEAGGREGWFRNLFLLTHPSSLGFPRGCTKEPLRTPQ